MTLADYGLSRDRGFLSSFDPANVTLPEFLHPVRDVALALPRILPTGRVRAHLDVCVVEPRDREAAEGDGEAVEAPRLVSGGGADVAAQRKLERALS